MEFRFLFSQDGRRNRHAIVADVERSALRIHRRRSNVAQRWTASEGSITVHCWSIRWTDSNTQWMGNYFHTFVFELGNNGSVFDFQINDHEAFNVLGDTQSDETDYSDSNTVASSNGDDDRTDESDAENADDQSMPDASEVCEAICSNRSISYDRKILQRGVDREKIATIIYKEWCRWVDYNIARNRPGKCYPLILMHCQNTVHIEWFCHFRFLAWGILIIEIGNIRKSPVRMLRRHTQRVRNRCRDNRGRIEGESKRHQETNSEWRLLSVCLLGTFDDCQKMIAPFSPNAFRKIEKSIFFSLFFHSFWKNFMARCQFTFHAEETTPFSELNM